MRDDFESGLRRRVAGRSCGGCRSTTPRSPATAPFPPVACNAPWMSVVIEADGVVRPCFFHEPIGNIREAPLATIVARRTCRRSAQTLDVGTQPGLRPLRVLDEDRLEERAVAVERVAAAETRSAPSTASRPSYDRSNAENRDACAACGGERSRRCSAHVPRGVARPRPRLRSGHRRRGARARTATGSPAIDWSPAMVDEARRRVRRRRARIASTSITSASTSSIALAPARVRRAPARTSARSTASPISQRAARLIARRLRPGGVLVASVIGRVCPWEIALYASRGDWPRAAIRFARGVRRRCRSNGRTVWTRYYTPGGVRAACSSAPGSRACRCERSACSCRRRTCRRLPTAIRRSSRALERLDDAVGAWPGFGTLGRSLSRSC